MLRFKVNEKSVLIRGIVWKSPIDREVVLPCIDLNNHFIRPDRSHIFLVFDVIGILHRTIERRGRRKPAKLADRVGEFEDIRGEYIAPRWIEPYSFGRTIGPATSFPLDVRISGRGYQLQELRRPAFRDLDLLL